MAEYQYTRSLFPLVISTATRTSRGVCSVVEEFGVLFVEAFSSYLLQLAHIRNTVGNSVVDIELNINNTIERAQGVYLYFVCENIDVVSI